MKKLFYIGITYFFLQANVTAQDYVSTNRNPVGLEYNLLFNADKIYTVSQTGSASLNISDLFNGYLGPSYTAVGPTTGDPTVILIEGLPKSHSQAGAWVGWSTRYWPAKKFKIEGYEEYYPNGWVTIVDYSSTDYSGNDFIVEVPKGAYTKLKFTFYEATGTNGRLGVSELFFIHPEATTPYANLIGAGGSWKKTGANIYVPNGNVGIGCTNPGEKLVVDGTIMATKVQIKTSADLPCSDYVFNQNYNLLSLADLEAFIQSNQHLPEVPSAEEFKENGYSVGEMDDILLRKVEELTLYIIKQEKKIQELETENKTLIEHDKVIHELIENIESLQNKVEQLEKTE